MLDKFIEYMKNEGMAQNTYESYVRDVKLFQKKLAEYQKLLINSLKR